MFVENIPRPILTSGFGAVGVTPAAGLDNGLKSVSVSSSSSSSSNNDSVLCLGGDFADSTFFASSYQMRKRIHHKSWCS